MSVVSARGWGDGHVHEGPLGEGQPPFVGRAVVSVGAAQQPSAGLLPDLLQIIPQ